MKWNAFLKEFSRKWTECIRNECEERAEDIAWQEIGYLLKCLKNWGSKDICIKGNTEVNSADKKKLIECLAERKKGKPLGYILNRQEFRGLDFKLNSHTLIPRPETEELVELVLAYLKKVEGKNIYLADIGTGSGCIGISVAGESGKTFKKVWLSDADKKSLSAASYNVRSYLKDIDVEIVQSDLTDFLKEFSFPENFLVVITANLPYLSKKEMEGLPVSVGGYEPKTALCGGKSGAEVIIKFISRVGQLKKSKGGNWQLFLEISPVIYPKLKNHLEEKKRKFSFYKDISGRIRFLAIQF